MFQAILAEGVGHTVQEHENEVFNFFSLSGGSISSLTTLPLVTSPTIASSPTNPPLSGGTVAHWAELTELNA
ncbi:hypothetical protein Clacol_003331 [Clathrus columnatus]|uniref:Uncharacterized protein n=1 Tax=Clathrus columnatus TaxID=1419009 RepID=A0AAV5A788_9AGAM|nr:hypothetical protein Clacol_003331 [Clathrus columnatus]